MRWIVGDLHGMLSPLRALLDSVHKLDPSPRFYFVGDYVNRGPDSKGVIDHLLTLSDAKFCRGNHDDIFDMVLTGQSFAPNAAMGDRTVAFRWFMQHGLAETFLSYGVDFAELETLETNPRLPKLESMLRCVPESHRTFIHSLPATIEDPDFFVAHGRWSADLPDETLTAQLQTNTRLRQELLWGRFEPAEITCKKAWRRTGYFGHTPVDSYHSLLPDPETLTPLVAPDIVLLDTAAALRMSGRLTAFCHETRQYVQINRFGIPLPLAQARP